MERSPPEHLGDSSSPAHTAPIQPRYKRPLAKRKTQGWRDALQFLPTPPPRDTEGRGGEREKRKNRDTHLAEDEGDQGVQLSVSYIGRGGDGISSGAREGGGEGWAVERPSREWQRSWLARGLSSLEAAPAAGKTGGPAAPTPLPQHNESKAMERRPKAGSPPKKRILERRKERLATRGCGRLERPAAAAAAPTPAAAGRIPASAQGREGAAALSHSGHAGSLTSVRHPPAAPVAGPATAAGWRRPGGTAPARRHSGRRPGRVGRFSAGRKKQAVLRSAAPSLSPPSSWLTRPKGREAPWPSRSAAGIRILPPVEGGHPW